MKFLHTSDLHIGLRLKNYDLYEEQKDVLNQMINAVKKYKSYAKNISTSSYLNWVCSSKYNLPVGTDNEYGWTENPWSDVVEFTNVDNSNKHMHRTFPAIGPIGPAARCLILQLSG